MRPSNSNDAMSSSNVVPMQCALPGSSTHGVEASLGEPSGDPGIQGQILRWRFHVGKRVHLLRVFFLKTKVKKTRNP